MEKKLHVGDAYFIDRPLTINKKMVFDGRFFLAERYYYIVRKTIGYLRNNKMDRKQEVECYCIQPILVRPNNFVCGQFNYTFWNKKIELNSRMQSFGMDDKMIKSILENMKYFHQPF